MFLLITDENLQQFIRRCYEIFIQLRYVHQRIVKFQFNAYLDCEGIVDALFVEVGDELVHEAWVGDGVELQNGLVEAAVGDSLDHVRLHEWLLALYEEKGKTELVCDRLVKFVV
jgi:hypothetical protein